MIRQVLHVAGTCLTWSFFCCAKEHGGLQDRKAKREQERLERQQKIAKARQDRLLRFKVPSAKQSHRNRPLSTFNKNGNILIDIDALFKKYI